MGSRHSTLKRTQVAQSEAKEHQTFICGAPSPPCHAAQWLHRLQPVLGHVQGLSPSQVLGLGAVGMQQCGSCSDSAQPRALPGTHARPQPAPLATAAPPSSPPGLST